MSDTEYPLFLVHRSPRQPTTYLCVAGPEHAVEIAEKGDPHTTEAQGFQYRILRSAPAVARRQAGGESLTREEWFEKAAILMLTHLASINDLLTLCEMARSTARRQKKPRADYSSVIKVLQSDDLSGSRRMRAVRQFASAPMKLIT